MQRVRVDHPTRAGVTAPSKDLELVNALRRGDESAFVTLIEQYDGSMRRLACIFVSDSTVAEDVVQEAWVGVLRGLAVFEGRSSLKTWLFSILTHCAKKRAQRERRTIPFSVVWDSTNDLNEPAVDPSRFRPADAPLWARNWSTFPQNWDHLPEERLLSQETLAIIRQAIDTLPPAQRSVITLRDVEGWTSTEVCNVLEISETNQRVLLHRSRAQVRQAVENYLKDQST